MIESNNLPKFRLKPVIKSDETGMDEMLFVIQEKKKFLFIEYWKDVLYNSGKNQFNAIVGTKNELIDKISHLNNILYYSETYE